MKDDKIHLGENVALGEREKEIERVREHVKREIARE